MALLRIQEESSPVPLLITDIVMPELNGWELFERIQAIHPDIKALFLSGYSGDILRPSEAITQGTDFLQKPFKRCELLKKVRQLLDGRPD
jgi:YesN/AraC family two-component response regulator